MSTFEELKAKGWLNLNKEERAEYQSYKELHGEPKEPEHDGVSMSSTDLRESERKTVTLSMKELEELIASKVETANARIAELQQQQRNMSAEMGLGEWKELDTNKKRKMYVYQKLYRENPDAPFGMVVGYGKYRPVRNEITNRIINEYYTITCLYDDGSKKDFELPLLQWAQITDREKVEVIDMQRKKVAKSHGKVRRSITDKEGYTRSRLAGEVSDNPEGSEFTDMLEVKDDITVTIKRVNGQTYTLPQKFLNI